MPLFVEGVVTEVEHRAGTMKTADQVTGVIGDRAWQNWLVAVGGETVKFRGPNAEGVCAVPPPNEGDRVKIAVAVDLRENRGNLLHPFLLVLQARSCEVVEDVAGAKARREGASLASVPTAAAK